MADIKLLRPVPPEHRDIFSPQALAFVAELTLRDREGLISAADIRHLRLMRRETQERIDAGNLPVMPYRSAQLAQDASWHARPVPDWLKRRWVEITGDAGDRKGMLYRANSGADVTLEDLEDASAPTWSNRVNAFANLRDFVRGELSFLHPAKGNLTLSDRPAVLKIRPRGLHLDEPRMLVDGAPVPASIFDFGFSFWHTAREMTANGFGPSYYIPKTEHSWEAQWWANLFAYAEDALGIPHGTSSITFLMEDILGVMHAEGIIEVAREYVDGLNCGRWDEIASFLYKFRRHPNGILPDRGLVTMSTPFMEAYAQHVIGVCHRRGIHAVGGMAAQVPFKGDAAFNELMFAKVREDKVRECRLGHDGTWVAHPDFVAVARNEFAEYLYERNHQINDVSYEAAPAERLLAGVTGPVTAEGVREVVYASLAYRRSYLNGVGAAGITYRRRDGSLYANLMEDAATCRISDNMVWRWLREGIVLDNGTRVDMESVSAAAKEFGTLADPAAKDYFAYLLDDTTPDHFTLRTQNLLLDAEAA
ncbi:MAG TPA: malate synthase A [Candidatus Paceibacterota bacterium]|nr:malate synthase A [Candidatus Paceibacterota bacterium]